MGKDVFKDLGFSEARSADLELRADLMDHLLNIIERRAYSQKELVKVLNVAQPHVSALMSGKIASFSSEKLAIYLRKLNSKVKVSATMPRKKVVCT